MLRSGNGDPRQCAANLIKITQGECSYERIKGLDPDITDSVSVTATVEAVAEVEWVINTFEPRAEVERVDIEVVSEKKGDFVIIPQIKLREEDDE
jgi:phage baseplate assembly protein W